MLTIILADTYNQQQIDDPVAASTYGHSSVVR